MSTGTSPIQKLEAFFIDKKRFQREIAMRGTLMPNEVKSAFTDAYNSNESDYQDVQKLDCIGSGYLFLNEVFELLTKEGYKINNEIDKVVENAFKCEYIENKVKKITDLIIYKVLNLIEQYPKIDMDNCCKKIISIVPHLDLLVKESKTEIRTINDINNIERFNVINFELTARADKSFEKESSINLKILSYDEIYVFFLTAICAMIGRQIEETIETNKYILEKEFTITTEPPFLIKGKGKAGEPPSTTIEDNLIKKGIKKPKEANSPSFENIEDIIEGKNNVKKFYEIEETFIKDEKPYLTKDENGNLQWKKSQKDLIALILILNERKYFSSQKFKSNRNDYKDFFVTRYKKEIGIYFEEARTKKIKLTDYKQAYFFIETAESD